jgi:steroid delta-isomerase
MQKEAVEKIVTEYFAAIRAMDVERWVATFALDAETNDPVGTPPIRGHEGLRHFLSGVMSIFEKVGLTENQVFVAGNGAAVKWTGHGKGKNGREVVFEGIDVFQINEAGRIQTVWAYWDMNAMLAQLLA